MTADGSMTDQTWEALSKHLEVARLVELVIVSTFYGAITRVLSTSRWMWSRSTAGTSKPSPGQVVGIVRDALVVRGRRRHATGRKKMSSTVHAPVVAGPHVAKDRADRAHEDG
jgi:hypothetical protein